MSTFISDLIKAMPALENIDTGGGCRALYHPLDGKGHVLITVANEAEVPGDSDASVDVGVYDADSHQIGLRNVASSDLKAHLEAVIRFADPIARAIDNEVAALFSHKSFR
jgi:hypothetical protein